MIAVDRWDLKHPPIVRFDEDGHQTAAARAELAAVPKASAAVLALTGISRQAAPTPSGQLLGAFLLGRLQDVPTSILIRLNGLRASPPGARLYRDQNGDGSSFYRIRYELPRVDGRRQRRAIYLGDDPLVAEWAAGILEEKRWRATLHMPPSVDHTRIAQLKRLRCRVTAVARQVAGRAGYTFRGARLMRRRYG